MRDFTAWMGDVDWWLDHVFGVTSGDLGEYDYKDDFDSGLSYAQSADAAYQKLTGWRP